jgi:uncharacterized protein (TIGR00725 family)
MKRKLQIGVIGYAGKEEYKGLGGASKKLLKLAEEVGQRLAKAGAIVVTGGKSGVMSAAAKGAKARNGTTVGVVKGAARFVSNSYTDVEVVTGMVADGLDELLIVLMSDAVIVLGGGAGTMQELALAYRNNKPIVVIQNTGGWAERIGDEYMDERKRRSVLFARTAQEAVSLALKAGK